MKWSPDAKRWHKVKSNSNDNDTSGSGAGGASAFAAFSHLGEDMQTFLSDQLSQLKTGGSSADLALQKNLLKNTLKQAVKDFNDGL